jgi:AraC-like DNA-binding protein
MTDQITTMATELDGQEQSVRQLRTALAEIHTALSRILSDERERAEESMERAAAILCPPEGLRESEERPAPASPLTTGGLAPWQVRKVAMHIETRLDQPIRSQDLAAILHLTASHFSRAFRTSFGRCPVEYIIRRRMERAQGLMLSTDAPLSRIALDCGLADQAHFSRLFRRVVGETPRAWRRARLSVPHSGRDFDAPDQWTYLRQSPALGKDIGSGSQMPGYSEKGEFLR